MGTRARNRSFGETDLLDREIRTSPRNRALRSSQGVNIDDLCSLAQRRVLKLVFDKPTEVVRHQREVLQVQALNYCRDHDCSDDSKSALLKLIAWIFTRRCALGAPFRHSLSRSSAPGAE